MKFVGLYDSFFYQRAMIHKIATSFRRMRCICPSCFLLFPSEAFSSFASVLDWLRDTWPRFAIDLVPYNPLNFTGRLLDYIRSAFFRKREKSFFFFHSSHRYTYIFFLCLASLAHSCVILRVKLLRSLFPFLLRFVERAWETSFGYFDIINFFFECSLSTRTFNSNLFSLYFLLEYFVKIYISCAIIVEF